MKLYFHPVSPPARSCEIFLRILKIEHDTIELDFSKKEQFSPEFLKFNPAHCVPTLVDGQLSIWESRAILQYLANQYAPGSSFYPSDPQKRAKIDSLLNWDQGTLWDAK